MALTAGSKAPDFTSKDENGKEVKLSDFRGKKLVLYFYPKDMTPGCTAESCNLRDNYNVLLKQGYDVLGVSTDNEKSHQKFIAREKLPFRLLADTDKSLHTKYGTWIEKSMYGRKYMGTARVTFIINENGVIDEIIGKVDTKNHTAQILKQDSPASGKPAAKKVAAKKPVKKAAKRVVKKAVKKTAKKAAKKKK
jgi:thioredoxin-dependent peroxiredoxin